MIRKFAVIVLVLADLVASAGAVERSGFLNVNGLSTPSLVMVDVLRGCTGWGGPLGADGQPSGDGGIQICDAGWNAYADGTYDLTFDGSATVAFTECRAKITGRYDPATNRSTYRCALSSLGNTAFVVTNTRKTARSPAGSGIANIRLRRPTTIGGATPHGPDELFSRGYLAMIGGGGSIKGIRFLDQCFGNGRQRTVALRHGLPGRDSRDDRDDGITTPDDRWQLTWALRRKPTDWFQSSGGGNGLAAELVFAQCNADPRSGKPNQDCWFNVYHYATADWIRNFCLAARWGTNGYVPYTGPPGSAVTSANPRPQPSKGPEWAGLNGRLFLENSNEWLFNNAAGFDQFEWAKRMALREDSLLGNHDLNWDGSTDVSVLARRWKGRRALEISTIAREVFGDDLFGIKIFPVVMGQAGNPAEIERFFEYPLRAAGLTINSDPARVKAAVRRLFTHLGAGWYRKQDVDAGYADLSVDQVFGVGMERVPEPAATLALCDKYDLPWAGYEGGWTYGDGAETPHVVPRSAKLTIRVRRDPRAARMARQCLDDAFAASPRVQILGHFEDTTGSWALCDTAGDLAGPAAFKYRGTVGGFAAWAANPANGASIEPVVPLAKVTGVAITPPTSFAAGGSVNWPATVLGDNAPLPLLDYGISRGTIDGGGTAQLPPAANRPMTITAVAIARADRTIRASASITLPADPSAPPPVADPSFETTATAVGVATNRAGLDPGSGWSVRSCLVVGPGDGFYGGNVPRSPYGQNALVLMPGGSATQTITGFARGTYTVTVSAAQVMAITGGGAARLRLLVDEVEVGSWAPAADRTWRPYTGTPVALVAGDHVVSLRCVGMANDNVLVDSVAIARRGGSPTPGRSGRP